MMKYFSLSFLATAITVLYMAMAFMNVYRLMYPLSFTDLSEYEKESLIRPLWDDSSKMRLKVYLSSRENYKLDFLHADVRAKNESYSATSPSDDIVLLWEEDIKGGSIAKSFLLTTLQDCGDDQSPCNNDASYQYATTWLDEVEKSFEDAGEGGITAMLSSAGEGIESTSVLLSLYTAISKQIGRLFHLLRGSAGYDEVESSFAEQNQPKRSEIRLNVDSPLWSVLGRNESLNVHVVLTRNDDAGVVTSYEDAARSLMRSRKSHSMLLGHVNLIKYEAPHHITPPRRLLYRDIEYLVKRYIFLQNRNSAPPPWDMSYSKPQEYENYQRAITMKNERIGFPYWKPQVSIKYVNEDILYPMDLAGYSGMEVVKLGGRSRSHPTGFAMIPGLHVDEMGLTSEKYIPVNQTLTSLPLRISFDRNDVASDKRRTTATSGGLSPARWRLLTHFSHALESQKELGFEQSDIDDLRRLIADTNVTLLAITMLASALHLLFEFLTFKNEVSFWRSNKDLTGLSVRSLFLDMFGQVIILLYLIEKDSSLLMTVPSAFGCAIALWKCQRGAGFKYVRVDKKKSSGNETKWWNWLPRLFGYELRATRLEVTETKRKKGSAKKENDLTALTIETDRMATKTLGAVLLPVVVAYAAYSFFCEEHTGWYSWLITSASSAVYALGFVLMTPQLFLNYKLKSVAHLPWRVLIYKFLNTFIDDLFAFIIRMPTMARISCFRDDVVFIIYLYQRWLYPVDTSRPVEGGSSQDNEKEKKA